MPNSSTLLYVQAVPLYFVVERIWLQTKQPRSPCLIPVGGLKRLGNKEGLIGGEARVKWLGIASIV